LLEKLLVESGTLIINGFAFSSFVRLLPVFADLQKVSYGVVMKKSDLEYLKRLRFIPCRIMSHNIPIDDGDRVYIEQQLPVYLQRREIIDGDTLNMVTVQDGGQVLFRFLVPCAARCESLGAGSPRLPNPSFCRASPGLEYRPTGGERAAHLPG
jgi:hypothetical protein